MQTVNIRQLKTNPSTALAAARADDMVVVMNRDRPQALLVDLEQLGVPDLPAMRVALAVSLFRIEALHLLRQLFGCVCITTTVRDGIVPAKAAFADVDLLVRTLAEGWIVVVEVPQSDYRPLNPGVDAGEASSIQAANHWREAGDAERNSPNRRGE